MKILYFFPRTTSDPVINPLRVAVRTAEMLVAAGLSPRRLLEPRPSDRTGVRGGKVAG